MTNPGVIAAVVAAIVLCIVGLFIGMSISAGRENIPSQSKPNPAMTATGGSTPSRSAPQEDSARLTEAARRDNPMPEVVSRSSWGARGPLTDRLVSHTPVRITLAHSGYKRSNRHSLAEKMRNLQHYAQNSAKHVSGRIKPPWADVPYHFYIDGQGKIAEGQQLEYEVDTLTDYDPTGHIVVALEGSFDSETPGEAQISALRSLLCWLSSRYDIPASEIRGHKDYTQTASPGKNLYALLPELRQYVDSERALVDSHY